MVDVEVPNHLKPSGNYVCHLIEQSATQHLLLWVSCAFQNHHRHHLQGLYLLASSDLPVRRIDASISSVVDLYFFFL
jgi:hypothetical protein